MQVSQRIVSLIASATEMLFALELGERVVAVSHECDYPAPARALPRATRSNVDSQLPSDAIDDQVRGLVSCGAPLYQLDERLIVELRPDLIVTQAQCDVCAVRYDDVLNLVRAHAELTGTRVLALSPNSLQDVLTDIERVGQAAGCEGSARRLVTAMRARIVNVQEAAASIPLASRPRMACLEWLAPLMLAANWMPDLVQLAGGQYELALAGRHSEYGRWSDLLAYDPEVVLVMPCGFDLSRTLVEAATLVDWPGWSGLSAVRDKRVYAVDGNAYFNRSGPRLVDSLEILAHLLHPDIFSPPLQPDVRPLAWRSLE